MLNNFIYAQTKDLFLEKLNAGEILDEAIVFIEDTKEIWNHGTYFGGGSGSGSEIDSELLSEIQTAVAQLQSDKADQSALADYALKSELPSLDGYLTKTAADGLYATIAQYNTLNQTVGNIQTELSNKATKDELSTGLAGKLDNSAASGFVPTTRKINGVALNEDITITATDPNAATKAELNSLSTNLTSEIDKKATSATTLAGYGITDGVNTVDDVQTGTYITDITIEGHTLKTTRGSHTVTGKEVTDALGYTPLQGADITNLASKTDVSNAVTPVSNRVTAIEELIDADSDAVIDKWEEVVTFLDGIGTDNDLEALLAAKANSSTVNALDTRVTNLTTSNIAEGSNLYFTNARAVSALSNTLASYVPTSRTINGKKLTGNITLSASDVGAASTNELNTTNTNLATVDAKFANYLNLATGGQLQDGSRIGYSGEELFIGNEENNGWVRFQDICSQKNNNYGNPSWEISETGESQFESLNFNDGGYLRHDSNDNLIIGNDSGNIYFDKPFGTFGIYCSYHPLRIGKGEDTVAFFTGDIIGSDYHGDDAAEDGYDGEQWRIGFEGDANFKSVKTSEKIIAEGGFVGNVTGNVSGSAGSATYASYLGNSSSNYSKSGLDTALGNKVDKVSGKGLSTNDFTTTLKNKLEALPTTFAPTNAEANVQADWNVSDSTSDAFIKNKPTIPTVPNLSGGSAAESGKYVSGVTVSGHTVTVTKGTLPTIPSKFTGSSATTSGNSGTNFSAAPGGHTHSVTASGSVSSSFSGTAATSGQNSGTNFSAAPGGHTHSVTASGSVSSSFTGSAVTSGANSGTNFSAAPGGHTHSVTAAGTVTLSGSAADGVLTITASFSGSAVTSGANSGTNTSVSPANHTHSVTAAGSVSSSFTGSAVTSGANSGTNTSVAPAKHTHSVTATGSVSSSFTGSAVTSGANSGTNGSVAPGGHTHTVTATGSIS